jgi:hypothetical protein
MVKSRYGILYYDINSFSSRSKLYMKILEIKGMEYILGENYMIWKNKNENQ